MAPCRHCEAGRGEQRQRGSHGPELCTTGPNTAQAGHRPPASHCVLSKTSEVQD